MTGALLVAGCGRSSSLAARRSSRARGGAHRSACSETGLLSRPGSRVTIDDGNRALSRRSIRCGPTARSKSRWVSPAGRRGDRRDGRGAWDFPVGTRFWKEFAFNGRKVETRMLWRASARPVVVCELRRGTTRRPMRCSRPNDGVPGVAESRPGKRHSIPVRERLPRVPRGERPTAARLHRAAALDRSRPAATHAEPLHAGDGDAGDARDRANALEAARSQRWSPRRRAFAPANPRTRAALGYSLANCGTCHNGSGEIAALGPLAEAATSCADGDAVASA